MLKLLAGECVALRIHSLIYGKENQVRDSVYLCFELHGKNQVQIGWKCTAQSQSGYSN